MLTVLLLLGASGLIHGQKYCCYPVQWEATEGLMSGSVEMGHAAVTTGNIALSMDSEAKKLALKEDTQTGSEHNDIQILQDFASGVEYVVDHGKCTRAPLTNKLMNCIPDDATKMMSFYFGAPDKQLPVTQYGFVYNGLQNVVAVTTDCVPTVLLTYGNVSDVSVLTGAGFRAFTIGIKDPTVFNVPAACNNSTLVEKHDHRLKRAIMALH